MMKARATSAMLVTAIAVDALVTIALFVSAVGVNGALDTSMTGPRRIERENRLKSDSRQGRTLNSGELSGIMDWEYGGWRPLQTPKGFYRRIARNLFRDDEGKGPNEVKRKEPKLKAEKFYFDRRLTQDAYIKLEEKQIKRDLQ